MVNASAAASEVALSNGLAGQAMTAREFWKQEMPGALELLLDASATLEADREKAASIAGRMGVQATGCGRYPRMVWELLYA